MIFEGLRIILSDIIKIIMERRGGSGGKKDWFIVYFR